MHLPTRGACRRPAPQPKPSPRQHRSASRRPASATKPRSPSRSPQCSHEQANGDVRCKPGLHSDKSGGGDDQLFMALLAKMPMPPRSVTCKGDAPRQYESLSQQAVRLQSDDFTVGMTRGGHWDRKAALQITPRLLFAWQGSGRRPARRQRDGDPGPVPDVAPNDGQLPGAEPYMQHRKMQPRHTASRTPPRVLSGALRIGL